MPTYEYQCDACGRIFEIRQRISEPALTRCETCGGVVKRLLSAAPFILKGEGWYVTDYPSESRKKARESEKSAGEKQDSAPAEKKASAGEKDSAPAEKKASAGEKQDSAPAEKSSPSTGSTPSTSASTPASSKPAG